MSESFAERLSKFTPDDRGIDRDVLLFAAGRASARPSRRWRALCAALAATQLLTLGLWLWPRPAVPLPGPIAPMAVNPPRPHPAAALRLWEMRQRAVATEGKLPPVIAAGDLLAGNPAVHAFGPLPKSLLE
jgi:hypothetical protein